MTAAPTAGGVVTSGVGVAGVGVGLLGMFGPVRVVHVGWLLPLSGVHIELDRLGGFFMALTGAVAAPVGCYLIGYVRREHLGRVPMAVVPLFVAAMLLVPAAGSVTTFLLAWELMAIASLILVLSEHARPQVRSAGLWYAVMTQLGFIAILVGLVVLAAAGGSDRFAGLGAVCDGVRAAVFMLTLVGFGSKAGLVPLHAWLPRAHPEAPSPVSALMSAAMVNLGIYGIVRFDLQLLGPGPRWWGLALLAVGGTSALYGVLQASVAADLKRLLAYSTTENMGLITLALGAATLFADTGAYGPASIAAAAAMLHMIAHAAFKSLAFMAAGSVLAATGLRDLDLLGGLARRMPATTVFFGVAALGACGLPLGAGFVSEWLLVQSLIHAAPGHDPIVALTTPLAVGVVALATGLSVAAMTKAFGIGFLARPRSTQAEAAREAPASMRAGMAIAAGACLVLAVAPHATIISIRQSSRAFEPVNPSSAGPNSDEKVKAGTLDSVARAVVHAANMGAKVINISVTACLPAAAPGDQRVLGAALWYAATVKDAVIVAAAGNDGEAGCGNNPMYDPLDPSDPRDWHQVTVVSSPSWFSDYVLSVGAVDAYGAALDKSMSGPWVGVAAPGTHIMGLSPQGGGPVNAYPPSRPGEKNMPFWGTSFSAAYVSGVAALVRAKFPELTAYQVINRIVQSAHNPPAGVDNKLGYGLVDPVAALTFNIPSGDRMAPGAQSRVITPAAPPPPPDHRARNIAIGFVGAVATGVLAMAIGARLRRAR